MDISKSVIETLEHSYIDVDLDEALLYLLSIYYDLKETFIPESLKKKVISTKIFKVEESGIVWNIPLFETHQDEKFEWVKEYCDMFYLMGKPPHYKECIARMKKLFSENPDIRKDEVFEATRAYIEVTDTKYIRMPHYFIYKGVGVDRVSDLLSWIEEIRDKQETIHNIQ